MTTTPEPAPEELATPEALRVAVDRVADAISADHPGGVTLVAVLKGSIVFLADLCRRITVPARVEFVALAPFDGAAARTRLVKDLDRPIAGEHVVLVTGIVDTGLTADFLRRHLAAQGPASLRLATLADKPARRLLPTGPDYAAIAAPDRFLIGYGLDYAGRYRNLPGLWAVDGAPLADDPDRHVAQLYPQRSPRDPVRGRPSR